jgi:superfamily I DNA/RNA helicase
MGWMIAKELLDETQRNTVNAVVAENGNLFIHGPAGCGKSVVLIHAIQDFLDNHLQAKLVLVSFTHALIELYKTGIRPDLINRVQICTMEKFKTSNFGHYQFIVIDEIQDTDLAVLNLIKQSGKRVVGTGDYFQSIYENKCELSDIKGLGNMQEPILPVIYRNTKSIHAIASYFADFPEQYRAYEVYKKQDDTSVQMAQFSSKLKEVDYVWHKAKQLANAGENTVIILPNQEKVLNFFSAIFLLESINPWSLVQNRFNKPDYGALNSYCQRQKIPACYLGNSYGSLQRIYDTNLITVMTYHSVKGLDFNTVFLPELTEGMKLWGNSAIERRLFFVALTRARKDLFLSYYGQPHDFIRLIPDFTVVKIDDPGVNQIIQDENDDFVF